jgi:hypothetical protein
MLAIDGAPPSDSKMWARVRPIVSSASASLLHDDPKAFESDIAEDR